MGNIFSSVFNKTYVHFEVTDKIVSHPVGEFVVLQDEVTGNFIHATEININEINIQDQEELERHQLFSHANIIKFEGFKKLDDESFLALYESYDFTLKDQIQTKKEKNEIFSEKEIFSILQGISSALAYFQNKQTWHGQVTFENIVKKGNEYKLIDPVLFENYHTSYQQALEKRDENIVRLLSPELLNALARRDPDPQFDEYKQDTYTLGVIILDLIVLDPDSPLPNKFELASRYSKNLMDLLDQMVQEDVSLRLDAVSCNKNIESIYYGFPLADNPDPEIVTNELKNQMKSVLPAYYDLEVSPKKASSSSLAGSPLSRKNSKARSKSAIKDTSSPKRIKKAGLDGIEDEASPSPQRELAFSQYIDRIDGLNKNGADVLHIQLFETSENKKSRIQIKEANDSVAPQEDLRSYFGTNSQFERSVSKETYENISTYVPKNESKNKPGSSDSPKEFPSVTVNGQPIGRLSNPAHQAEDSKAIRNQPYNFPYINTDTSLAALPESHTSPKSEVNYTYGFAKPADPKNGYEQYYLQSNYTKDEKHNLNLGNINKSMEDDRALSSNFASSMTDISKFFSKDISNVKTQEDLQNNDIFERLEIFKSTNADLYTLITQAPLTKDKVIKLQPVAYSDFETKNSGTNGSNENSPYKTKESYLSVLTSSNFKSDAQSYSPSTLKYSGELYSDNKYSEKNYENRDTHLQNNSYQYSSSNTHKTEDVTIRQDFPNIVNNAYSASQKNQFEYASNRMSETYHNAFLTSSDINNKYYYNQSAPESSSKDLYEKIISDAQSPHLTELFSPTIYEPKVTNTKYNQIQHSKTVPNLDLAASFEKFYQGLSNQALGINSKDNTMPALKMGAISSIDISSEKYNYSTDMIDENIRSVDYGISLGVLGSKHDEEKNGRSYDLKQADLKHETLNDDTKKAFKRHEEIEQLINQVDKLTQKSYLHTGTDKDSHRSYNKDKLAVAPSMHHSVSLNIKSNKEGNRHLYDHTSLRHSAYPSSVSKTTSFERNDDARDETKHSLFSCGLTNSKDGKNPRSSLPQQESKKLYLNSQNNDYSKYLGFDRGSYSSTEFSTLKETKAIQLEPQRNSNEETSIVFKVYSDGSRYEGEMLGDFRHGQGKFTGKDGTLYDGNWKLDRKDGYGILYNTSKKIMYEGEWKNDVQEGNGVQYNQNIVHLVENYVTRPFDKNHNTWVQYEGDFKEGKWNGFGKLTFSNNDFYQGMFKNDSMSGKGSYTVDVKPVVAGEWHNNTLVNMF